jgi:hypothetical protein
MPKNTLIPPPHPKKKKKKRIKKERERERAAQFPLVNKYSAQLNGFFHQQKATKLPTSAKKSREQRTSLQSTFLLHTLVAFYTVLSFIGQSAAKPRSYAHALHC